MKNLSLFSLFKELKRKILFIINPISGGKDKKGFPALANASLDLELFDPEYQFTRYPRHGFEIASEAVKNGVDIVVAVGGDGTINEVASALTGTDTMLGIVPCGSGNGLARSLNISLNNRKALQILSRLRADKIDTGVLNDWKFFNMGGIGFDAHISHKFATMVSRGLKGYLTTTFHEILSYKPQYYSLEIDDKQVETYAFMISIANSSQYGNNAHISPEASVKDGLLDVCIVKPFPLYHFPVMGYHLFSKTSHKSRFVEIIKGRNIRIRTDKPRVVHIDGEPREVSGDISVHINPLSLTILH